MKELGTVGVIVVLSVPQSEERITDRSTLLFEKMVVKTEPASTTGPSLTVKTKKKVQASPLMETCPSFRRGHLPKNVDVERLRYLTRPHVESFNYFLEIGLSKGIKDLEPSELDLIDPTRLRNEQERNNIDWDGITTIRYWVEDITIHKPTHRDSGRNVFRLLPHESRERSLMYSGEMSGTFCYQLVQRRNGVEMKGTAHRMPKTFGKIPIMIGSKACHLEGLKPSQLVALKEEVSCSGLLVWKHGLYITGLRLFFCAGQ